MKRTILMSIISCCFAVCLHAASGKCGDYLKWKLNSSGVLLIEGLGDMDNYSSSPKQLSPWFKYQNKIRSVIIDANVSSIGDYAFFGCENIDSIAINSSIMRIGSYAFFDCENLKSIQMPNSVTDIGTCAFMNCRNMRQANISSKVTKIGDQTFSGCSSLTSITIPNNVASIGKKAFYTCINLHDITLPTNIKSIKEATFSCCYRLVSIEIPNGVISIEGHAFENCSSLTSISIPNSVTSIGYGVFYGCVSLTSVIIPNSVTKIEGSTFHGCRNLTTISLSDNIRTISSYMFSGCSTLTSISIPNKVTKIEENAFKDCRKLKEITLPVGTDISKAGITQGVNLVRLDATIKPQQAPSFSHQLPLLELVDGSLVFADASRNNRIEVGEQCYIQFKIVNKGSGPAQNCEARVKLSGNTVGITVNAIKLPSIPSNGTYDVSIPIEAGINTQDGKVIFSIEINEPNGFGIVPFNLAISTKSYEPPHLQVVDYSITSNSGKVRKMEPFSLSFNLQNTLYGTAEDVKVRINLPNNVFIVEGEKDLVYPRIQSGEVVKVKLSLIANNNYSYADIPIDIDVTEKYKKYADNRHLDIALNQTTSSTINIAAKDEPQQERKEIKLATIGSAVDKNIPVTNLQNKNTFAVIIANENYQQVAKVPFALNDGNIFKQYCEKTLGIPATNIHFVSDATINNIRQQVNWISQVMKAYNGTAKVIFYYAGHGVPDEKSKTAFLLPVDGNGSDITTGYKLDDLYLTLGSLPSQSITIFLDACFSGSKREDGMLASARGVAIKVNKGQPTGNMVVFSAATGDETAYPNNQEGHGMFTYFLLKKIQETKGDVTYDELGNYIKQNVSQQSIVLNGKSQTPTIIASPSVTDWQNWKLK